MVLVKFVAFVVFEVLCNLVFIRNSLYANSCWRSKISKTIQRDLMFIYDKLPEFVSIFVSNLIFLAVKNVSFT